MANQPVHDVTQGKPSDALIKRLKAEDEQFRNAYPLKEVVAAKRRPGIRMAEIVKTVMEGYATRPALGQRGRELVTDPATGRSTLKLLGRFDTITYGELWRRGKAVAGEWHAHPDHPLRPGDFVCVLGFTSPQYATLLLSVIHLGGVLVPLQTSAPTSQHAAIIAETGPCILAAGIDYVDAAVSAALAGTAPKRLVVFDYDARDDDQREALEAARRRLAEAGSAIPVDTLDELVKRGETLSEPPLFTAPDGEDPLTALFYTSGSTGTPKGAVFTESLSVGTWLGDTDVPAFTLSFMPMAHLVGHGYLIRALANGGTSFCSPRADLSTLFEDFSLARPTMASIVPRVCELFYHHYLGEYDKRVARGEDPALADAEVKRELREEILGGRLLSVGCGSASLAPETYEFMEAMLGFHIPIGYSSTEIAGGTVAVDWKVQRPPVIDYKLRDVPELGYFTTDKPHPRGELLVKSDRFTGGYYKQPELTAEKWDADGFYATGDIMAEMGPDHIVFLDRVNNVIKLSQGEFVAVSKLEADYAHAKDIRQIYIHGSSERAFLVAVIVPSEELGARIGPDGAGLSDVRTALRRALNRIADEKQLNGYEIPRDFIVETEPFSLKNGLLSEVGKHQRPKLRARYNDELDQLYSQLAQDQLEEMRALRLAGADQPVLETVGRALQATLGISHADISPDVQFADLGGDSLSALSFSTLLEEIFGIEVPVGVIISPAGSVSQLADYIEAARGTAGSRATFASVHDAASDTVAAGELKLDKFIDAETLAGAPSLPRPAADISTVLVTGVTGFLGRFQMLAWLERMAECGGKVICIARGRDAADAKRRVEATLDTDPALTGHFRSLAANLEVLPGDLALPTLGLSDEVFARLAREVDLIVHPAAHVNHVLPYHQLFAANVAGTAELVRLALTSRLKHFHYVSTLGINGFSRGLVDEEADIREAIPACELDDSYANGYGISKWAGEVLLREAHELAGLPVAVFRPGMILAHSRYVGQINVPDMFTRLLFSLIVTGVAPATFYAQDLSNGRPEGRYDGLAVDFLADAVTAIGAKHRAGFQSYNLSGGPQVGASLDAITDWLVSAGCPIERIAPYDSWLEHFETAMHALPEEQRQESMLAILGPYRRPQMTGMGAAMPADRFQSGCKEAGIPIPKLSENLIHQYVAGLRRHGLIAELEAA